MPRLVEISTACNTGSTGHIAEAIGLLAQKAGWDVLYVHSGRYVCPSQLPTLQVQSRWMEYAHYFLSLCTGHHGWFSTFATRRLIKKLRRFNPDIVHLHNIHGYYINYKILFEYLKENNIAVVWTWHDCWPITGHCAYYGTETGVCEKWVSQCGKCTKLKDYPRSLADSSAVDYQTKKRIFRSVDRLTIVPVSYWMEQNVKRSFFCDKPTCVIRNGIDLNVFYPHPNRETLRRKWDIEQDKYVLLGVASQWNERKGYADILSLASIAGCQLVLVGLTHAQKLSLPAGIIGIEHTENAEQLAELYSLADVFVNPTYSDTFPTTNLEALACGTPVLTYRTDGSPETINEQVGVVVERGDKQALQEAIYRLQASPLERDACAEFARARYDKDTCFKAYIELYNRILDI